MLAAARPGLEAATGPAGRARLLRVDGHGPGGRGRPRTLRRRRARGPRWPSTLGRSGAAAGRSSKPPRRSTPRPGPGRRPGRAPGAVTSLARAATLLDEQDHRHELVGRLQVADARGQHARPQPRPRRRRCPCAWPGCRAWPRAARATSSTATPAPSAARCEHPRPAERGTTGDRRRHRGRRGRGDRRHVGAAARAAVPAGLHPGDRRGTRRRAGHPAEGRDPSRLDGRPAAGPDGPAAGPGRRVGTAHAGRPPAAPRSERDTLGQPVDPQQRQAIAGRSRGPRRRPPPRRRGPARGPRPRPGEHAARCPSAVAAWRPPPPGPTPD